MVDFIDDYDALTVDEIVERLEDRPAEDLVALKAHEADHKARVTLLDEIDTRLDRHEGGDSTGDRAEAEDSPRDVGESDDTDGPQDNESVQGAGLPDESGTASDERTDDGDAVGVNTPDSGDEVLVRYMGHGRGYAAGHWFDAAYEERTVTYDKRIADAVDEGTLRLLD